MQNSSQSALFPGSSFHIEKQLLNAPSPGHPLMPAQSAVKLQNTTGSQSITMRTYFDAVERRHEGEGSLSPIWDER